MINNSKEIVTFDGIPYQKHVMLADVNIPYNLSIDRKKNNLFFCINADEFSDQTFQLVVLNLDTELPTIIPGIRNGFASAVDQVTGDVYLGGSDGIFKYNYCMNGVVQPALVGSVDIFDMYYNGSLYFVDTRTQSLHTFKNNKCSLVDIKGNLIQHFIIDGSSNLYYVNSSGLFMLQKGSEEPILINRNNMNIRGAALDVHGVPFFIANDGIYSLNKESKILYKKLTVSNGNGIAFDKNNNIIYSEERTINALRPHWGSNQKKGKKESESMQKMKLSK